MEDVRGGNNSYVGIVVKHLNLDLLITTLINQFCQIQVSASVIAEMLAGKTVPVWPFVLYLIMALDVNFG